MRKSAPRSGLIPVRVFVAAGKVAGHMKTVYKRAIPAQSTPGVVGPRDVDDKTQKLHEAEGRGYHALVYVNEDDYAKFFMLKDRHEHEAQADAEQLLSQIGVSIENRPAEDELSQVGLNVSEGAIEWAVEMAETIIGDYLTKEPEKNKWENIVKQQTKIRSRDFVHGLLDESRLMNQRSYQRLQEIASDKGIPLNYVSGPLKGRTKSRDALLSGLFEKLSLPDTSQIAKPRNAESYLDVERRMEKLELAMRAILRWHIRAATLAHLPSDDRTYIKDWKHPFERQEQARPQLPASALGEPFSLSRKVAKGELVPPVRVRRRETRRGGIVHHTDVSTELFGKPITSSSRYMTKSEWDTLLAELMGSRVASFEDGKLVMTSVPDLTKTKTKDAQKVWRSGVMDIVHAAALSYARNGDIGRHSMQRLMGAGLVGVFQALAEYDIDRARKIDDWDNDPAKALMYHVANQANKRISLEATRIFGETKGEEQQALMTMERKYGGAWGAARIVFHAINDAYRLNSVMGFFGEPTREDIILAGEQYRYSIEKYLPKEVQADPDAWRKWLDHHLENGVQKISYDEAPDDPEGGGDPGVIKSHDVMRDAATFSRLESGGRPRTLGNDGRSDVTFTRWERDSDGNIVRGYRDPKTGVVSTSTLPSPGNPAGVEHMNKVLVDPWTRNFDRHGNPIIDPHYGDNIIRRKGQPVPNEDATTTIRGGTVVTGHQVEKLEMASKVRDELMNALNDTSAQDFRFTPDMARAADFLYFRGMPLVMEHTYSYTDRNVQAYEDEIAKLKGELKAMPDIVRSTIARMQRDGYKIGDIRKFQADRRDHADYLKKELAHQTKLLKAAVPVVKVPQMASAVNATPGMMNYPGIPVNTEGEPRRDMLRAVFPKAGSDGEDLRMGNLDDKVIDKLGKDAAYDAAFHIALTMELSKEKYNAWLTSSEDREDHDNPDLRARTKIYRYGAREVGGRRAPWGEEPWVVVQIPGGVKEVPLYSLVNDKNFTEAHKIVTQVQRVVRKRGYLNPEHKKHGDRGLLPAARVIHQLRLGHTPTVAYDKKEGKLIVGSNLPDVRYSVKDNKLTVTHGLGAKKVGSKDVTKKGPLRPVPQWAQTDYPGVHEGPPSGLSSTVLDVESKTRSKKSPEFHEWQKKNAQAFARRKAESRHGPVQTGRPRTKTRRGAEKETVFRPEVSTDLEVARGFDSDIDPKTYAERHNMIINEAPTSTLAGRELSKLYEEMGINLQAVADTRDIIHHESLAQRERLTAPKGQSAEAAVAQSRGLPRPPLLRSLSAQHLLSAWNTVNSGKLGAKYLISTGRAAEHKLIKPVRSEEAFEKETVKVSVPKGKKTVERTVTRVKVQEEGPEKGKRVLKPGVERGERPRFAFRSRGALFGRYKGPDVMETPYKEETSVQPGRQPVQGAKESEIRELRPPSAVPLTSNPEAMWAAHRMTSSPSAVDGVLPPFKQDLDASGQKVFRQSSTDPKTIKPNDLEGKRRALDAIHAKHPEIAERYYKSSIPGYYVRVKPSQLSSAQGVELRKRIAELTQGKKTPSKRSPETPQEFRDRIAVEEPGERPLRGREKRPRARPERTTVPRSPRLDEETVAGRKKFMFSETPHVFNFTPREGNQ